MPSSCTDHEHLYNVIALTRVLTLPFLANCGLWFAKAKVLAKGLDFWMTAWGRAVLLQLLKTGH